jgi:DNA-binding SARP family transcriptional activator
MRKKFVKLVKLQKTPNNYREHTLQYIQVSTLGNVALRSANSETRINFPTRKAQAILIYLALSPGQTRSREHLADVFWQRSAEEQGRASLRQTLSSLRKAINTGNDECIGSDTHSIYLAEDKFQVDVLEFETHAVADNIESLLRAAHL